jgi:uncharacterized small protein (DUF1192 family)
MLWAAFSIAARRRASRNMIGQKRSHSPALRSLTWGIIRATMRGMDFEDASPRMRKGDIIAQLTREDLDPLSVAELDERILALTAEIDRTRAKRDGAVNHKASAEALFKK